VQVVRHLWVFEMVNGGCGLRLLNRSDEANDNKMIYELPGLFTVLQGTPGDCISNTIDSLPKFQLSDFEQPRYSQEENDDGFENVQHDAAELQQQSIQSALHLWKLDCRRTQYSHMKQVLQSQHSRAILECENFGYLQRHTWWQRNGGQLAVFATPTIHYPTLIGDEDEDDDLMVLGSLPPGTLVKALELVKALPAPPLVEPSPFEDLSQITFMRIEEPLHGFVVYKRQTYCYLAPGHISQLVQPETWIWRVTCLDGAVVRKGLELNSQHMTTIPYGEFIHVNRKTVNAMGLSRLFVKPIHLTNREVSADKEQHEAAQTPENLDNQKQNQWTQALQRDGGGWISQVLNPLSGQSGPIAQPLSFPIPALYKVIIEDGAVIRSGIELSSASLGTAVKGTVLRVTGRAFSEHPMDMCLERLQLAGAGGWISLRLNRPDPYNLWVVEFVGLDPDFNTSQPGRYHYDRMKETLEKHPSLFRSLTYDASLLPHSIADDHLPADCHQDMQDTPNLSSALVVQNDNYFQTPDPTRTAQRPKKLPYLKREVKEEKCVICLTENRNATIVHGGTGHIACCLTCARILKARGDKCPVCRLPIDLVIQQFWA